MALRASFVAQLVKNPPAIRETWVWSLSQEDPLEVEQATHFSMGEFHELCSPWGCKESDVTECLSRSLPEGQRHSHWCSAGPCWVGLPAGPHGLRPPVLLASPLWWWDSKIFKSSQVRSKDLSSRVNPCVKKSRVLGKTCQFVFLHL